MKGLSTTTIVIFSVLVLVSANTQNAFGDKPDAIIFVYNGPGGLLEGFDEGPMGVTNQYTITPDGDQNGVIVSDGDIVTVTAGTSPLTDHAPELDTDSHFKVNGIELFVIPPSGDQTVGDNPHTSCSKDLKVGNFMLMIADNGNIHKLTVLSVEGSTDPECEEGDIPPPPPPDIVGGHGGITDNTALLVSGSHLTASWMVPLIVSAIGIGVFVVTRK